MNTELKVESCDMELDGAEGGTVWLFGNDDNWLYFRCHELPKVIKFLQQFIKEER